MNAVQVIAIVKDRANGNKDRVNGNSVPFQNEHSNVRFKSEWKRILDDMFLYSHPIKLKRTSIISRV